MEVPWDINGVRLNVTKHFAIAYMRDWGWDMTDLRDALRSAYKITKEGKSKFEVYVNKNGYKKIITVYCSVESELLCFTGSEGGNPI